MRDFNVFKAPNHQAWVVSQGLTWMDDPRTIFTGEGMEVRAREYAAWKNLLAKLPPEWGLQPVQFRAEEDSDILGNWNPFPSSGQNDQMGNYVRIDGCTCTPGPEVTDYTKLGNAATVIHQADCELTKAFMAERAKKKAEDAASPCEQAGMKFCPDCDSWHYATYAKCKKSWRDREPML